MNSPDFKHFFRSAMRRPRAAIWKQNAEAVNVSPFAIVHDGSIAV
jgi:hypothetical protein